MAGKGGEDQYYKTGQIYEAFMGGFHDEFCLSEKEIGVDTGIYRYPCAETRPGQGLLNGLDFGMLLLQLC